MQHDRFVTYHGDCLSFLQSLPTKLAVISDPPYGIGYRHGKQDPDLNKRKGLHKGGRFAVVKTESIIGDDKPFDPSPWIHYPWVALFGFQHFYTKLPQSSSLIVWDKKCGIGYEGFSLSDGDIIWTNGKFSLKIIRHLWMGLARDSQVKGAGGINASLHPTEKPIAVMMKIIQSLKIPKDVPILDPYMGSGTTGVAALRLGYTFIGIEILEKYYAIANERLLKEAMQPLIPLEEEDEVTYVYTERINEWQLQKST